MTHVYRDSISNAASLELTQLEHPMLWIKMVQLDNELDSATLVFLRPKMGY